LEAHMQPASSRPGNHQNCATGPEKGTRVKQALESQHCVWGCDWW
jgi:hypothetical protein